MRINTNPSTGYFAVDLDEMPGNGAVVGPIEISMPGRGHVHVRTTQRASACRIRGADGEVIARARPLVAMEAHAIDAGGTPGPIVIEFEGVTGGLIEVETTELDTEPTRGI